MSWLHPSNMHVTACVKTKNIDKKVAHHHDELRQNIEQKKVARRQDGSNASGSGTTYIHCWMIRNKSSWLFTSSRVTSARTAVTISGDRKI